jgi:hypothetical protein
MPPAPWSAWARCGSAVGWLLAARPPADERRADELLQRIVERRSALLLQRLTAQGAAMTAGLLERLTHSMRTDVGTLQAVAEGLAQGVFDPGELQQIPGELASVGRQAQRRLSAVREVMTVLQRPAPRPAEPLEESLRAELDGAGVRVKIDGVADERAMTVIPGAGWAACARLLAEALAGDERLGGDRATVGVRPDPRGWAVTAGRQDAAAQPVAWTEPAVGELVVAGQIAAAAGGWTSAVQGDAGHLHVELVVPAAPSG